MYEKKASGKVRDIYRAGEGLLLMVATDRISAYDVVLEDRIPDKGKVLTGLTLFFASKVEDIIPTHIVTADPAQFPSGWQEVDELSDAPGRALLVKEARMLPVEFVVRGYLFGSAYEEYKATGSVKGADLPPGLSLADRLDTPIFTPTTKAETGHDMPLTHEEAARICGEEVFEQAKAAALAVFERASTITEKSGIILADTKFEFGFAGDELVLADEILTPDSSRFWDAKTYTPGRSPHSFDKQFVRDYLDSTGWNRNPPAPKLPEEVIEATRGRYLEAYERITGEPFSEYLKRYSTVSV